LSRLDSSSSVREELGSTYKKCIRRKLRTTLDMRQRSLSVFTPEEATIRARFVVKGEDASWLLLTMTKFKAGTQKALETAKHGKTRFTELVKASMSIVGNNRYARGSAKIVQGIIESIKALQKLGENISLNDVKLGNWWMIQSIGARNDTSEKGNRNIRLIGDNDAEILVYDGASWRRIKVKYKASKRYSIVLNEVAKLGMENKLGYLARVILLNYSLHRAYCELQVTVPWNLYMKYLPVKGHVRGDNIGGIDVNLDRINLAIVSRQGVLLDTYTARFPELKEQGLNYDKRTSIVMNAIHKVLDYAVNHGCSLIVLENPKTLGYLRWVWIRRGKRRNSTWNRRVSLFTVEIVERISWHTPQYELKIYYVNPLYTSKLAEAIAKNIGLDRHTGSAYILALEYLGLNPKEAYQNLQKP